MRKGTCSKMGRILSDSRKGIFFDFEANVGTHDRRGRTRDVC